MRGADGACGGKEGSIMSTPQLGLGGRSLTSAESTGLEREALGPWGVFAQGLAAAAPSVALATVPYSLFVAAGKGASWAVLVGLALTILIATTAVLVAFTEAVGGMAKWIR